MNFFGQLGEGLVWRAAVGARLAIAVLGLLHQPGQTHLDVLIQVAGRDCQKFHAFQKRVCGVAGLFQNALVKLHPGKMAIEESLRVRDDNSLRHSTSEAGKGIVRILLACYGYADSLVEWASRGPSDADSGDSHNTIIFIGLP